MCNIDVINIHYIIRINGIYRRHYVFSIALRILSHFYLLSLNCDRSHFHLSFTPTNHSVLVVTASSYYISEKF